MCYHAQPAILLTEFSLAQFGFSRYTNNSCKIRVNTILYQKEMSALEFFFLCDIGLTI
jgi:hypothetical protein